MYNGNEELEFINELHAKLIKILVKEMLKKVKFENSKDIEDDPILFILHYYKAYLIDIFLFNCWTEIIMIVIVKTDR